MKKRFKGFTLIECLIAIAILGIASLAMAQIYAGVSRRNRNNQILNTSLSNQMSYVERYVKNATGSAPDVVEIYYGGGSVSSPDPNAIGQSGGSGQPPHQHSSGTNTSYVKITRTTPNASDPSKFTHVDAETYSFPVDTFVLLSRDQNDNSSAAGNFDDQYEDYLMSGSTDKNTNLRYKYVTGHAN
ncbi:MAG: prepilin-type N-terminal cleavage/methylation domain-containing protein [Prevotella sp.]|nr:prepilin-type N-terminal cleavage/methylation domain-containing protein [Prevotella sp.]